jgi:hypothetical protein
MTAGEVRTVAALIGELGSTNFSRRRSAPIPAISPMTPRSRLMSSRCFFHRARHLMSRLASCSSLLLIGPRHPYRAGSEPIVDACDDVTRSGRV